MSPGYPYSANGKLPLALVLRPRLQIGHLQSEDFFMPTSYRIATEELARTSTTAHFMKSQGHAAASHFMMSWSLRYVDYKGKVISLLLSNKLYILSLIRLRPS